MAAASIGSTRIKPTELCLNPQRCEFVLYSNSLRRLACNGSESGLMVGGSIGIDTAREFKCLSVRAPGQVDQERLLAALSRRIDEASGEARRSASTSGSAPRGSTWLLPIEGNRPATVGGFQARTKIPREHGRGDRNGLHEAQPRRRSQGPRRGVLPADAD